MTGTRTGSVAGGAPTGGGSDRGPLRVRSLHFVPGGAPHLLTKVARFDPDVVVVDLEDAVAATEKDTVRAAALAALRAARPGADVVLARINPTGTTWHAADLAAAADAVADGVLDGVVLPKYDRSEQLVAVRSALPAGARVVVGIENGLGVADARQLLRGEGTHPPDAAYFGAEDFVADIGGRRTSAGAEVLHARSAVVLAARLADVVPVDQAVVAVHDTDAYLRDAHAGVDLGYQGKITLHPTQVAAAHDAFTPTGEQVAHARAVLTAAESGVGVVDGQMVDAVHVAMARTTLRRAGGG